MHCEESHTVGRNRAALEPKEVPTAGAGDQDTNMAIFVADAIHMCLQMYPKETPKTKRKPGKQREQTGLLVTK